MTTYNKKIKNIGLQSKKMLASIGVNTLEDIQKVGVINIIKMLRLRGFAVTLNLAYALEGAIRNVHWLELPETIKNELKTRFFS